MIEQIHLVVLVAYFIGKTAGPRLDRVELMESLIVTRLTDVDLRALCHVARSTLEVARVEHDEAFAFHFINAVITVPTRLHDLVGEEVFVEAVHCLLGSIIPAHIDPVLALRILVCAVYLSRDRLCQVIRILNVHPISDLV